MVIHLASVATNIHDAVIMLECDLVPDQVKLLKVMLE